MSRVKFKIQGTGLDTKNLEYAPIDYDDFEYVIGSLSANNPYEVSGILNSCKDDVKLVLQTDFLDSLDLAISGYLNEIQRDKVDLLLIDSKCDIAKYVEVLGVLIESGVIEHLGISNPVSGVQLEGIKNIIPDLVYVSLELCPLNFNKEVIDWCSRNNIKLLGFNTFGGHLSSPSIIESFTVPYLLNFSALYCDLVILSGSSISRAVENDKYLKELYEEEVDEKDYALVKSVSKLIRPMKKCINSALILEDDCLVLPFNSPSEVYSYKEVGLSFKTQKLQDLSDVNEKPDIIEEKVNLGISSMKRPEDGDYLSYISILRPRIFGVFQEYYNDSWELGYFRAADNVFVFIVQRKDKINHYLLYVNDKDIIFRKLKNGE